MFTKKDKSAILMGVLAVFLMTAFIIPASATDCSNAGDFSGICDTFIGIANGSLAILSILFTGSNASIIIQAAVILAIIGAVLDLARGESSFLRKHFWRYSYMARDFNFVKHF